MPLNIGTLLQGGKYKIVRFISSGGFGCTYEAEHTMLKGRVAIKEFFVSDLCNRDSDTGHVSVGITSKVALFNKLRRKFVDEAVALFHLAHPGIVHVSDVFEENGTAYFVMDFIKGRSLADIVHQEGPMSEARALGYIRQVCAALNYVHSQNRLHLDIKPQNIMVDGADRAILIDFGASKQYDEESGENTSSLLGLTPGYAPPEQSSQDLQHFYPATDIYA
ncbi:MAG: serine/threonine protein kinase, partial [Muribaculaceae bacterium]